MRRQQQYCRYICVETAYVVFLVSRPTMQCVCSCSNTWYVGSKQQAYLGRTVSRLIADITAYLVPKLKVWLNFARIEVEIKDRSRSSTVEDCAKDRDRLFSVGIAIESIAIGYGDDNPTLMCVDRDKLRTRNIVHLVCTIVSRIVNM